MTEADPAERVLRAALTGINEDAVHLLAPLLRYDREHGGDLVRTLRTYLELECNASASADALFLHRSGLLYRLRRIEALLGLRLDEFEHRVALELALLALAGSGRGQSGG